MGDQLERYAYAQITSSETKFKQAFANPALNVNWKSDSNITLFHKAVLEGKKNIVVVMLANPLVDPNLRSSGGKEVPDDTSPFFSACQFGRTEVVKILLADPRIDVNERNGGPNKAMTPLMGAAQFGMEEVARLLLADPRIVVNGQDASGRTALFLASMHGQLSTSYAITKHSRGVDPTLRSKAGPEGWMGKSPAEVARWAADQPKFPGVFGDLPEKRKSQCPLIASHLENFEKELREAGFFKDREQQQQQVMPMQVQEGLTPSPTPSFPARTMFSPHSQISTTLVLCTPENLGEYLTTRGFYDQATFLALRQRRVDGEGLISLVGNSGAHVSLGIPSSTFHLLANVVHNETKNYNPETLAQIGHKRRREILAGEEANTPQRAKATKFISEITPPVGTFGTRITFTLSSPSEHLGSQTRIIFLSDTNGINLVVEAGVSPDHRSLQCVFPLSSAPGVEGLLNTDVSFSVLIESVSDTFTFLWTPPAFLEATAFLRSRGMEKVLHDEASAEVTRKVHFMGQEERAHLVHAFAILGLVPSLIILQTRYNVDLTVPSPRTRENLMHAALRSNRLDLVRLAASSHVSMDLPDHTSHTPRELALALPEGHECRTFLLSAGLLSPSSSSSSSTPNPLRPFGSIHALYQQSEVQDFVTRALSSATTFITRAQKVQGETEALLYRASMSASEAEQFVDGVEETLLKSPNHPSVPDLLSLFLRLFYYDDEIKFQTGMKVFGGDSGLLEIIGAQQKAPDLGFHFVRLFQESFDRIFMEESNLSGSFSALMALPNIFPSSSSPLAAELATLHLAPSPLVLFKLGLFLEDSKFRKVVKETRVALEGALKQFEAENTSVSNAIARLTPDFVTRDDIDALRTAALEPASQQIVSLAREWEHAKATFSPPNETRLSAVEAKYMGVLTQVYLLETTTQPANEVDLSKTICNGQGLQPLSSPEHPVSFAFQLFSSDRHVVANCLQFVSINITQHRQRLTPSVSKDPSTAFCHVTYAPSGPGIVCVSVKYKGRHLPESPYHVFVPSKRAPINMSGKPFGLAFIRDSLFVADTPNGILIEYPPKSDLFRIVKTDFNSPRGLAVSRDNVLFLADSFHNSIVMLRPDGTEVGRFGAKGDADSQLRVPRHACPLPNGLVLVCDTDHNRLQVFDSTGKLLRKVGTSGEGPGEFKFPLCAVVNPVTFNEIAVADTDNHRVQFFDLNFAYLGEIGTVNDPATGRYEVQPRMQKPNSVVYDSAGHLYVSELVSHFVRIFSPERKLIHTLGGPGSEDDNLQGPRALAIAPDGALAIADHDNGRVVFA